MNVRVFVTLKNGVLDPQGRAITQTLNGEGFEELKEAKVGKLIELKLDTQDREQAKARVSEMCEKLLANTVIERYEIEFPEA